MKKFEPLVPLTGIENYKIKELSAHFLVFTLLAAVKFRVQ